MNVIPQPQQFTVDWNKVVQNTHDAVTYSVDTDTNGSYETTTNLKSVFQDITTPTTTSSLIGTLAPNSTTNYIETVNVQLNGTDTPWWSWIYKTYFTLDNYYPTFTPYTVPITINGIWNYTLKYYSVDRFGNIESTQVKNFSIVPQPETYSWKISGYIYEDANSNNIKDTWENTMAWWKVYIDKNNNGIYEENIERCQVTNNQGYYEFNSLATWTYKVRIVPKPNWTTTPTTLQYNITLSNWQSLSKK